MKKQIFLFAIMSLLSAASARADMADVPVPNQTAAQIQIFYDYQGFDNYSSKMVSTAYYPLSAAFMLTGPLTAACYKGDPSEALTLFSTMIRIYNSEQRRAIRMVSGEFYFYADGRGALRITTLDEMGRPFLVYPRMIECDRWATDQELAASQPR